MYFLSLFVVLIYFIGSCLSLTGTCDYFYLPDVTTGSYECIFSYPQFTNENDITYINGTHLQGFTDDDVTTVRVVRDSNLPAVPTIFCRQFRNLISLALSRNNLHTLTVNSFSSCIHLEFLLLTQNAIKEIPANVFERNIELKELFFSYSYVARIEDYAFRNLAKLELLELHNNEIQQITPNTFSGLSNLRELTLFSNLIPELPLNSFRDLISIQNLPMFTNRITRVHPDFLESLPDAQINLSLFNNICISNAFTFTKERINEIKPQFSACFDNYRNHH